VLDLRLGLRVGVLTHLDNHPEALLEGHPVLVRLKLDVGESGLGCVSVGVAQLAGLVRGDKWYMAVSRLLLHLLRLGDARGLGLAVRECHRVKTALVRPGEALELTGSLLPREARAHGAVFHGNLRSLGWCVGILGRPRLLCLDLDGIRARQVLGDKLLIRKIVVNCDASQEAGGVLLKSGGEDGTERVHLRVVKFDDLVGGIW